MDEKINILQTLHENRKRDYSLVALLNDYLFPVLSPLVVDYAENVLSPEEIKCIQIVINDRKPKEIYSDKSDMCIQLFTIMCVEPTLLIDNGIDFDKALEYYYEGICENKLSESHKLFYDHLFDFRAMIKIPYLVQYPSMYPGAVKEDIIKLTILDDDQEYYVKILMDGHRHILNTKFSIIHKLLKYKTSAKELNASVKSRRFKGINLKIFCGLKIQEYAQFVIYPNEMTTN